MKILLLNNSYLPLGIVNMERAMILLLTEKADIVHEHSNRKVRTISEEYPYPEVIRLKKLVHFKKVNPAPTKYSIMQRDNFTCQYCGCKEKSKLTIDHIVPRSVKKDNSYNNLVTCCSTCNKRKGDKPLRQFLNETGYKFKKPSSEMSHLSMIRNWSLEYDIESWKAYLFLN